MKGIAWVLTVAGLPLLCCAQSIAQRVANKGPEASLAVTHATAYLRPGEPAVEDATVLIVDGRIQAAGKRIAVPAGMRTVDAHGKMLTPGLMNSYTQLGLIETGTEETNDPAVVSGPLGAAFDVQYAINPNSTLLGVARADGLTRAMALPTGSSTPPFDGLGCVLRLNERPEIIDRADAVEVAEIGGMTAPKSGGSRAAQWMLLRHALTAAQQAKRPDEPGPLLSAQNLDALAPVLARKIPLAILASRESDLRQAVTLADDYKIRVVLIGAEEGWRVAALLAMHKIPVVLDPYASGPSTYDAIGSRLDNAAILDRAGVIVSFRASFVHVSYNAGIALREGAGIAVANGLPWAHALRALTSGAAETWGIAEHYGTLAPGQDADVVLWDGDPLEPTSAPALVLVQGQEVPLVTRQNKLEQRYSPRLAGDPVPPAFR
jgi:imidazolonepropionase-like amidohydrolase